LKINLEIKMKSKEPNKYAIRGEYDLQLQEQLPIPVYNTATENTQGELESPVEDLALSVEKILSDRPIAFAQAVNKAFNEVSTQGMEIFRYDGSSEDYSIAGVDNVGLIASMLKTYSDQGKTSFTFMDIGAGRHGCADYVAKYINDNNDSFPNINRVEIISLSGDNAQPNQEIQGICKVSKISSFKIEEIKRWLHPSDDLIAVYEKLKDASTVSGNLRTSISEIQSWIEQYDPLIIARIMESGKWADIFQSDFSDAKKRSDAYTQLQKANEKFQSLESSYESSVDAYKEHYGIDINIYKDRSAANEEPGFQQSVEDPKKLTAGILENIKEVTRFLDESNIQSKLEINVSSELATLKKIKEMNLPDTVDYATSSWCFRHLTDPAGTLIQTYNLLTPGTGIFHGDGFLLDINYHGQNLSKILGYYSGMLTFLHNLHIPYIYDIEDNSSRRIGGFIISRVSEETLEANFQYKSMDLYCSHGNNGLQSYSGKVTIIDADEDWEFPGSNYTYRSNPYELFGVRGGLNDLVAKYQGMFGKGTMWNKGIYMKSAETALLIGKLKHEGISVGTQKLSSDEYKVLFGFIRAEYPDMPFISYSSDIALEALTKCYALYDTACNGTVNQLEYLISQDLLNSGNRNMIFVAAENNRTDNFTRLLEIFNKKITPDGGLKLIELIKLKAFNVAIKSEAIGILQLFTSCEIEVQYDAKAAWSLLKTAYPHDYHKLSKVEEEVINYIISHFTGDIQELWKLASYRPSFLSQKVQIYFDITLVAEDIEQLMKSDNSGIYEILFEGFAAKEQLLAVNDLKKIALLTSKNSFKLYKDNIVEFEKLSLCDVAKLEQLTNPNSTVLCNEGITTFDKLMEIDVDRLNELLSYSTVSLCKAGITTFDTLAIIDAKKLNILIKRCHDINILVKEYNVLFANIAKLDINTLNEALGNITFYGLHDKAKVAERVEVVLLAIDDLTNSAHNLDLLAISGDVAESPPELM